MPATRLIRLLTVLVLCSRVCGVAPAEAQPQDPAQQTETPKTPGDLAAEIKKGLEDLKQNTSLSEDVKKRVQSQYEDAQKRFEGAEVFRKQLANFEDLKKQSATLEKGALEELSKRVDDPQVENLDELEFREVESRLKSAQAEKVVAEQNRAQWEEIQKNRAQRREIVPQRLEEAKKELDKFQTDLQAPPPAGESAEAVGALRALQRAQIASLTAEIAALEAEIPTYNETDKLIDTLVRAANHQLQRMDRIVKFWEKQVQEHRGKEARDQINEAQNLVENFQNRKLPAAVVELAETNRGFAEERAGAEGTVRLLKLTSDEIDHRESQLKRLQTDFKNLEERLKIEGIAGDIGPLLVEQRRRLPSTGSIRRQLAGRAGDLARLRLQYLKTQERLDQFDNFDEHMEATLQEIGDNASDVERPVVEASVRMALRHRRTVLESLVGDYRSLLDRLGQLSTVERRVIEATDNLRTLIDKHILWVPTTTPFGPEHFDSVADAVALLTTPDEWLSTAIALADSMFARPVFSTLAVFLLALGLLKQAAMKSRLTSLGEQAGKGLTEPFELTVKALFLSILISAVWPGVMLTAGWQLENYAGAHSTSFSAAVGTALIVTAVTLWTLEFLRRILRTKGLAAAHFRWKDAKLNQLRVHLRWFMVSSVPGVFLYGVLHEYGDEAFYSSLGRLLLIGLLLLTSGFLAVVLRTPRVKLPFQDKLGIDHTVPARHASYWQLAAYAVFVSSPVSLAIVSAVGYHYTADLLTWKLLLTAWLLLFLLLVHAMSIRWLYLARGRLALEQVQAAQAKAAEEAAAAAAAQAEAEGDGSAQSDGSTSNGNRPPASASPVQETSAPPTTSPVADLAVINSQTRRLLRIFVSTGLVVGLWLVWADVLPALKFLQIPLWHNQVETTRMVPKEGVMVPENITVNRPFTLGKLMLIAAIVFVVFIAAANLPGLLEVAVLQRLPIDSGARYAASSLARYIIFAIGTIVAFNLMGLGWGKIQWLIAALGVGLGFGLQEIFANFVSGIILLFERPLRVGDIVTIGDVSGSVTKIQIRATTIVDWDRKEYIVPNKELVTGKLMNWTLTDTVSRIVVNVGVSYGSDPDQVTAVLYEAVLSNSNVMENPAPLVTFEEFGDSSLNFVVRCHVPVISMRLATIHALHREIQRRFKQADIEIPFPQRDLHIRSDETQGNGVLRGRESQEVEVHHD